MAQKLQLIKRAAAATLAVSAAGGAGWMAAEGFSDTAYMPRPGDRWTIGHGSTFYSDGRPVRQGDKITRAAAQELALSELNSTYGACVRDSLGQHAAMSQIEFDLAADFAGQYGCSTWNKSTMRAAYTMGEYTQACEAYGNYRFVSSSKNEGAGWEQVGPGRWRFDCSTPGNKVCRGVWDRSKKRAIQCLEQSP